MFTTTLRRVLKMSLISFWRNSWLSLTGTLVMIITLVIISCFFILNITVNRTATLLKDKIDIVVYFKDEPALNQIMDVKKLLLLRSDVKQVTYVSKDEARTRFQDMQSFGSDLTSIFSESENPLPRSLEIKPDQAESAGELFKYLKDPSFSPLIKKISYEENKVVIDRLLKFTSFVTKTGIVMSSVFILISFLIIFNTIKLTIFSRKDEIEIMRLVGATDVYVKFPFVVEGMLYGVLATIVAGVLTYSSFSLVVPAINNYLGDIDIGLTQFIGGNLLTIFVGQLVVGLALGGFCSWLATRRYVK